MVLPEDRRREMNDLRVRELDQTEADDLRGSLRGECLGLVKAAFKTEEDRRAGDGGWALPRDCRVYYLVLLDETPCFLVGINLRPAQTVNISSFARVIAEPPAYVLFRLRRLMEGTLVNMCHDLKKRFILAQAFTHEGERLLRWLKAKGLRGVECITFERSFWKAVVSAAPS